MLMQHCKTRFRTCLVCEPIVEAQCACAIYIYVCTHILSVNTLPLITFVCSDDACLFGHLLHGLSHRSSRPLAAEPRDPGRSLVLRRFSRLVPTLPLLVLLARPLLRLHERLPLPHSSSKPLKDNLSWNHGMRVSRVV